MYQSSHSFLLFSIMIFCDNQYIMLSHHSVTLWFTVPPFIARSQGEELHVATEGGAVTMKCDVGGVPEPLVTWLKDGQILQTEDNAHIRILSGGQVRSKLHKAVYVYRGIVSKFSINVPNRCLWNAVVHASFLVDFPVFSCQDIRCCKIHMSGWEYGWLNREVLQAGSSGYATSHLYICLTTTCCNPHLFLPDFPLNNWQCADL